MHSPSSPTAAQMFLAAVGEQILTYRETAGITQGELAGAVGISTARLDRIERGSVDCGIVLFWAISGALAVSAQELIDVDGTELGLAASGGGRT